MTNETGNTALGAVNHMKKKGILKIVIIGFALGIILLLVGSFFFKDKDEKVDESGQTASSKENFLDYKQGMRKEMMTRDDFLKKILKSGGKPWY